jgi:hypothetical protein
MLFDVSRRQAVLEELSRVKELLGAPGASERAAAVAIEIAQRRGARSGWAGRRGNRP